MNCTTFVYMVLLLQSTLTIAVSQQSKVAFDYQVPIDDNPAANSQAKYDDIGPNIDDIAASSHPTRLIGGDSTGE